MPEHNKKQIKLKGLQNKTNRNVKRNLKKILWNSYATVNNPLFADQKNELTNKQTYYKLGRSSFEIVVKPVFDSCDCCIVQGQLVPDGHWILSSGSPGSPGSQGSFGSLGSLGSSGLKNVTCIKGQLYKLEEINELEGNEKFENISNF
jgi:hypothetical protein